MDHDAADHHHRDVDDVVRHRQRDPDLADTPPPVDSYRVEIEFMDAAAEFQLRELIDYYRRHGRQNMIAALNDALRSHCLQVVEAVDA